MGGHSRRYMRMPYRASLTFRPHHFTFRRHQFEVACRNGEIVRILFAIDACDGEIIAWTGTTAGISGETVRDLTVACIERRFGISKAPRPSNGCPITARFIYRQGHSRYGHALGLNICFTPVRSPQSNGIAEPFKRDYARLSFLKASVTKALAFKEASRSP